MLCVNVGIHGVHVCSAACFRVHVTFFSDMFQGACDQAQHYLEKVLETDYPDRSLMMHENSDIPTSRRLACAKVCRLLFSLIFTSFFITNACIFLYFSIKQQK